MHIVFVHNLRTKQDESQAEFDNPETIDALHRALLRLGHEVTLLDVSGPVSAAIATLENLKPDLVFNTAEGRRGKFREALYPSIFEELNLPYTGSDPNSCMITLDKQLTKQLIAKQGILTPRWIFLTNEKEIADCQIEFPLFVKPNFEGSSKGIKPDSIVRNSEEFEKKAKELLRQFPEGILVEEYIDGDDFTVSFINGATQTGVLPPCAYRYSNGLIYDYHSKNETSESVEVFLAKFNDNDFEFIAKNAQIIFNTLSVRDLARIDYRRDRKGNIYFLEINALPSLEPGAGIYLAASQVGLASIESVLEKVISSASERFQISPPKKARKRLKIGITYNLKRVVPKLNGEHDHEAEFDSIETINAISQAIESLGHEPIPLEAKSDLISKLNKTPVDLIFNMAEGFHGRNRESQVPALLELLGMEYTGSDATTMSVTLDKWMAKKIVEEHKVLTPKSYQIGSIKDRLPTHLRYPLIIKPALEGSSKGIFQNSVVDNEHELKKRVAECLPRYKQPLLIEEYIAGREFTVGLLGENKLKILPIMEIVFQNSEDEFPVYSFQHKLNFSSDVRYDVPAKLSHELEKRIIKTAKTCFQSLRCRDIARIDFRVDKHENIYFLECNPLPGLVPDWSDLCLMSKGAGMTHAQLIANILAPAIKRFQQKTLLKRMASHDVLEGEAMSKQGDNPNALTSLRKERIKSYAGLCNSSITAADASSIQS